MFVIFVVNNLLFFLYYILLWPYIIICLHTISVFFFSPTLVLNLYLMVENLFSYKRFIIKRKLYMIVTVMI